MIDIINPYKYPITAAKIAFTNKGDFSKYLERKKLITQIDINPAI